MVSEALFIITELKIHTDIHYFYLTVKGCIALFETRGLLVTFETRQMAAGDEMKSVTQTLFGC